MKEVNKMLYITGQHALNLSCSLDTGGDWHTSALQWENLHLFDSNKMFFKDYGIELDKRVPEHIEKYNVANHIRALLDLLEIGNFALAQGMNNDFICNANYDNEIFDKVSQLRFLKHWDKIDAFMGKEYLMKWVNYKKAHNFFTPLTSTNVSSEITVSLHNCNEVIKEKYFSFIQRNSITDIQSILYICENYWEYLDTTTKTFLYGLFEYNNLSTIDYLIETQTCGEYDANSLKDIFISTSNKLGLNIQ